MLNEIWILLRKDALLEWRQRYALNGVLLYVTSTVFVCYLSFNLKRGALTPPVWNALLWVILVFAAINSTAKSFLQEREGRFWFYYSLVRPQSVILAKILYNTALMSVIGLLALLVYSLMMDNPVQDHLLFVTNLLVGSAGLAASLTMIAGIAAKAGQNSSLMAVLSLPVILPLLLLVIRVSRHAIDGLQRSVSTDELVQVLAVNLLVTALSYLLFPMLWKS